MATNQPQPNQPPSTSNQPNVSAFPAQRLIYPRAIKPQLDQPETPTLPIRYDRWFGLAPNQQDKAHAEAMIAATQLGQRRDHIRTTTLWCDLVDVVESTEAAEMLDAIASRLTPNTFAAGLGQDMADRLAQRWLDTSAMNQELFDAEVSDLMRRRK